MIPLRISGAASQIVDAGKTVLAIGSEIQDMSKISLAAYARKTILTSRAYVDRSVAHEAITKDILQAIHKLYVSFILNALQMNRLVTKDHTVQDLINVVATETLEQFFDIGAAFEAFDEEEYHRRKEIDAQYEDKKHARDTVRTDAQKAKDEQERKNQLTMAKTEGNTGMSEVKLDTNELPVGKVIEITLTNPENKEANLKLNLMVQILPFIVSENIAYKLLTMDALPSFWQRITQWRAGEIDSIADLLFQIDLVKERNRALREDKGGVLADYLIWNKVEQRKKLIENIVKDPHLRARNVANTILVLNEDTVKQAKAERGFDLHREADRLSFFGTSLTMAIAVVNTQYNQVTLYFNGLKDGGTYTFDQFKNASKKGDSALDIITAMSTFSRGTAPKF